MSQAQIRYRKSKLIGKKSENKYIAQKLVEKKWTPILVVFSQTRVKNWVTMATA